MPCVNHEYVTLPSVTTLLLRLHRIYYSALSKLPEAKSLEFEKYAVTISHERMSIKLLCRLGRVIKCKDDPIGYMIENGIDAVIAEQYWNDWFTPHYANEVMEITDRIVTLERCLREYSDANIFSRTLNRLLNDSDYMGIIEENLELGSRFQKILGALKCD